MRRAALGLLICLLLACSGPPVNERQQADQALAAARDAGAATYAPDELKAADAALKAYDDAVAQRDFRLALSHALDARDHGYEAAKLAADQKKAVSKQASTLIADTKTLLASADARLSGGKLPGRTGDRLKQATRTARLAMQEASALVAKENYRGAVKRMTGVPDNLRKEFAALDTTPKRGRGEKQPPTSFLP